MKKIKINEKKYKTSASTAYAVRDEANPKADVIILNGHLLKMDSPLKDGDEIYLITKGEKPSEKEARKMLTARHTPGIQEKLDNAKVAICGLGGLGSNAAASLARMGVGKLLLIDFDVVITSNINRQFYFINQIGMKKTKALKKNLMRINPYLEYKTKNLYINNDNIDGLFDGYDCVIEAFDDAANKALLITAMVSKYPDIFTIGASGVAGSESTFDFTKKRIGKNAVIIGDFENEARPGRGLMAARVTAAANVQANEVIRYILGEK